MKNVLLVDDDGEDREFFISVVAQIDPDIQVAVASCKQELFEELARLQPDILFIDSFLDYESGIAGVAEIRNQMGLSNLPIVIYSGSSDTMNIRKAFTAGASLYVVKPQSLKEMKSVLEEVLQIRWNEISPFENQYYLDGVLKTCE